MRTLLAFSVSVALFSTSCTGAGVSESRSREPIWPLGYYSLVSVNGLGLPVELPSGEILQGGSCVLYEGRTGVTSFRLSFRYEGEPRIDRDRAPKMLAGRIEIQDRVGGKPRAPVRFLIKSRGEYDDVESGSILSYPVEDEASGDLFGNELRMGRGHESLVFMRGPAPRWRRQSPSLSPELARRPSLH